MRFSGRLAMEFCWFALPVLALPIPGAAPPQGASAPRSRVTGSVTAVASQARQVSLKTDKGETITVATGDPVDSDSTMKKLDPQTSAMLARRYGPGRGQGAADGSAPEGRGAGGDLSQMLERLPAIPLADLKAGDAVMVSTTMGSDPSRVTAVMLLAGVEPLLTAAPNATRDIMSGWNPGGGGGGEGN